MTACVGFSVGTTNLVAAADGGRPIVRPAVLSLGRQRDGNALVLGGFVDRVGDPVPVVASDGSVHSADRLTAEALDALIRSAGPRFDHTTVAVPAHWDRRAMDALRSQLGRVAVVSDAVAALTALRARPGLPARGVVVLVDVGAGGTSITLADAAAGFANVAPTVRYEEFSGDLVDQAVLRHVLAGLDVDPSGTLAVAALARLREQCRAAKERLTYQAATSVGLPAQPGRVRLTRAELDSLLRDPLDGLLGALQEVLLRNNIAPAQLAAVATCGGGSAIPLVTQRLSEVLRLPVTTAPMPELLAATGAQLIARQAAQPEEATREVPPQIDVTTVRAAPLAWSAVDSVAELVGFDGTEDARPELCFEEDEFDDERAARLRWYRRPGVIFAGAACLALLAVIGLVLTGRTGDVAAVSVNPAGPTTPVAPQQPAAVVVDAPVAEAPVADAPTAEAPVAAPRTVVAREPAPPPSAVRQATADEAPAVAPPAPVAAPPAAAPPPAAPPAAAPQRAAPPLLPLPRWLSALPLPGWPPVHAPAASSPEPAPPASLPESTQATDTPAAETSSASEGSTPDTAEPACVPATGETC